jgi:aspartate/tyrosine/aromatic aminotransferase
MYSNPPMHGALIVAKILNNKENFAEWQKELRDDVANRIIKMRSLLRAEL